MPIDNIETQRLRIRSFQRHDWQAVYDYTSDPAVMVYIPEGPLTPEQAKAFVADNMGDHARRCCPPQDSQYAHWAHGVSSVVCPADV